MSLKVNLLPPEKRPARFSRIKLVVGCGLLFFIVCVSFYGWGVYRTHRLNEELQYIKQQNQLIQPLRGKMEDISRYQADGKRRGDLLSKLRTGHIRWSGVILHLGNITPTSLWLTELHVTGVETLEIKGFAIDYPTVAEYLKILEKDEFFTQATLIEAQTEMLKNREITRFQIVVRIRMMSA